jgi:nuclear pore complex protein Nup98-Nup96
VDGEQHSNAMDYIEKEQFIIDQLRVPEKWIFWAKAIRADSFHNYNVQAKYLLKARQWTRAHYPATYST